MKNKDLFGLKESLEEVKDLKGVKFSFYAAKNLKEISNVIGLLEDSVKPTQAFLDMEQERQELLKEYSNKDEDGNPITKDIGGGRVQFDISDMKSFEKAVKELEKKYPEVIKEREEQLAEYNNLLDEDFDTARLTLFDSDDLPKGMTIKTMIRLNKIIDFSIVGEEVELTHAQIQSFDRGIMVFTNTENTKDFNVALTYNYLALSDIITEINNVIAPNQDYIVYLNERELLIRQHAKRNEKGDIEYTVDDSGNTRVVLENATELNKALKTLDEKYEETIKLYNDMVGENEKYLKLTRKVNIKKIPLDIIPEDVTPNSLMTIDYLLAE